MQQVKNDTYKMNDTLSTLKMFFATALILFSAATYAQNNRLNTYENIGWYGYFGTFKLSDKWGIHTDGEIVLSPTGSRVY